MTTINETNLPDMLYKGKVRDTYGLGDGQLLMVATDRLSAFDVVLPTGIPEKGIVLCQISAFWFEKLTHIIPNHFIALATDRPELDIPVDIARRAMVVKLAERIDVECIVRGLITGSAWSEYKRSGTVSGQPMPEGLVEGDRFPEPIFTHTTKADEGHDESITIEEMGDMVGKDLTSRLAEVSIALFTFARDFAAERGIIIADTKFEFGLDANGEVVLIDEVLTPDSSRFWPADEYAPGSSPPSFDKQYVRDYLETTGWDKTPPAPSLPAQIIERTSQKYQEARDRLIA